MAPTLAAMARSRLTDDQHLEIRLSSTARRLARAYVDRSVAVDELREMAGGRADLLAIRLWSGARCSSP